MKILIVEDEKPSAEHLAMLLHKIDASIEIVAQLDTVKGTVKAFQAGLEVDLILLDIHLADGNSFEIFNQIKLDLPIIFCTAYDSYALDAFKLNSIDYLLKPITLDALTAACAKFKNARPSYKEGLLQDLYQTILATNKTYKTRFMVKSGQTIEVVQTDDIHHFETNNSLSFLITKQGKRYTIDYTLDALESMLQPSQFFRINRRVILASKAIEKVTPYFKDRLIVHTNYIEDEDRIISRERVSMFKHWLDS
jgi:DNA-binding LytR/AlgR family response regulator